MLVEELYKRKSFKSIRHVLKGYVLEDLQCADVMTALAAKRSIFRYDTGMGKTLLASAVMKLLKREDRTRKFLFIGKASQVIQTPRKISECTGLKVLATSAEADELQANVYSGKFLNYDVLMITHEALNDTALMLTLHKYRKQFCGVIVDEAHELSNYVTADRALMLQAVCRYFEYVYALTATPMKIDTLELARLMHIVNPQLAKSAEGTASWIEEDPERLKTCWTGLLLSRTREEFGVEGTYLTHVHMVDPMPYQFDANGADMFRITRGEGAQPQVQKLIEIINSYKPSQGLVYIRQHAIREYVVEQLKKAGITYGCINGRTSMKERALTIKQFEAKNIDIIISSVTTALDLDCDYIVFYEFTLDFKQMLGRAYRGLNPKTLNIDFIFTKHTAEMDYFMSNIYNRMILVQQIMGQDCSEIIQAANEIKYFLPD